MISDCVCRRSFKPPTRRVLQRRSGGCSRANELIAWQNKALSRLQYIVMYIIARGHLQQQKSSCEPLPLNPE